MKALIWFSRFFVGTLFIFSGLVKANDALGFSYKLVEYFEKFAEIFNNNSLGFLAYPMEFFAYIAFPLSFIIVVGEIVLGVLTLLGVGMRKVSTWLMIMILFFTFLTFVSWAFDLVKSCGCFGDAIPLNPFQSFIKDLILLVFISVLFIFRNTINSFLTPIGDKLAVLSTAIVFSLFTLYCYKHLPVIDFRPYAPGNSLVEKMQVIKGNPLVMYHFKHKTLGVEVHMSDYPDDWENWEYINFENIDGELDVKIIEISSTKQKTKVLSIPEVFANDWKILSDTTIFFEPDIDPKIQQLSAFDFKDGDVDYIPEMLSSDGYYFWLIIRNMDEFGTFQNTDSGMNFIANNDYAAMFDQLNNFSKQINSVGGKFYVLCSEGYYEKVEAFRHGVQAEFPFYSSDDTELKTMIRSSPGMLLLKKDTVINKWHYNDFPKFEQIKEAYFNQ